MKLPFIEKTWNEVSITQSKTGFGIYLDKSYLRSFNGYKITLPTKKLAEKVQRELKKENVGNKYRIMPATRLIFESFDKIKEKRTSVIDQLIEYADTDIVCYRDLEKGTLNDIQARNWDPLLNWSEVKLGIRLEHRKGIQYKAQNSLELKKARTILNNCTFFELVAVNKLIELSGSFIIGQAVAKNFCSASKGWENSFLEELWQNEIWGTDSDAQAILQEKKKEFVFAKSFLKLLEI